MDAMPASNGRGGAGACTTVLSQPRQAYFGRMVRSTRRMAGTTSSASCTLSPIRRIWQAQHGQIVLSGSITRSQRGRCLASDPTLRCAGWRGRRGAAFVASGWSSLAGSGLASVTRSARSSAICCFVMA